MTPLVSTTYISVWLFFGKEKENGNNCSLYLHLCDTERPEPPPWNCVKKAERATWQRSSGGLKWLQYSGISHDSWILREASGYTAPCVIFYISSSKVRRGTLKEAMQPDPGTLAWCKYEVKLFQFMYFSLSVAPWNAKGNKIELFEMWSSALIFFFFFHRKAVADCIHFTTLTNVTGSLLHWILCPYQ